MFVPGSVSFLHFNYQVLHGISFSLSYRDKLWIFSSTLKVWFESLSWLPLLLKALLISGRIFGQVSYVRSKCCLKMPLNIGRGCNFPQNAYTLQSSFQVLKSLTFFWNCCSPETCFSHFLEQNVSHNTLSYVCLMCFLLKLHQEAGTTKYFKCKTLILCPMLIWIFFYKANIFDCECPVW